MADLRQRHKGSGAQDHSIAAAKTSRSRQKASGLSLGAPFVVLIISRLVSAWYNPVHDCDEVFNYWEPLHYLVYGIGMQTWEYSAQFALRSYWYLILHWPVAALGALAFGHEAKKRLVFNTVKACLGIFSAYLETGLYRSVVRMTSKRCGSLFLLFLVMGTSMFISSTSLLPSSFAMYMLTGAATSVLDRKPVKVIAFAVILVTWGWPVAGVALIPYAIWTLFQKRLLTNISSLLAFTFAALLPVIVADRIFYGSRTVSLWNFVRYNVVGGGDSGLYGVESWTYYFRNGLLNFNVLLPFALLAPLLAAFRPNTKPGTRRLLVSALLPIWSWFIAITLLPHKEERFLYVIYPLMCLGAAISIEALYLTALYQASTNQAAKKVLKATLTFGLLGFSLLSISRCTALVNYYGAPMKIYNSLPKVLSMSWGWILLMKLFTDLLHGGTATSSPYLNDRNREEPANYWVDDQRCDYFVDIQANFSRRIGEDWRIIQSIPFVLASESRSLLARALYIPWYSSRRNQIVQYVLLERQRPPGNQLMDTLSETKSTHGRPF